MGISTALRSARLTREGLYRRMKESLPWYPFILVNVVVFVAFTGVPYALMVGYSFHHWDILTPMKLAGLENYAHLVDDSLLHLALKNTLAYTLMEVPLQVVLSLLVAIFVSRPLRGMKFFKTLYFLPNVTSITVLCLIFWRFLAPRPDGPINYLIGLLGIPPQTYFVDPKLALPSIVGVSIWSGFGYYMLLWLAALKGIPVELYDAAKVDGASGWKVHYYVTLPLLRPTAAFITIIATIGALKVFGSIYMLTGGGPLHATTTVAYHIYQLAFVFNQMGYACTVSILLLFLILAITLLQGKYLRFGEGLY